MVVCSLLLFMILSVHVYVGGMNKCVNLQKMAIDFADYMLQFAAVKNYAL